MIDYYIIKFENTVKIEFHQNGDISNAVNL